jgi:predicted alpha/beta superfamily hydrolase
VKALLGITATLWAGVAFAQTPTAASPITLGVSHAITSKPLSEERTINVVLPPGYSKQTDRRYPVIYVIDGGVDQDLLHVAGVVQLGSMWGRMAEAIVLGIETKDRRRELVGPTRGPELLKKYPTAGGSAAFRDFIRNEVKPLVERSYRTDGRDAVIGESLAGLFILETYMVEPQLFDGYAAIDPSLWWDKQALSKTAAASIGSAQKGRSLYLAMGKEQAEQPAAMNRLLARLRSVGAPLCFAARRDLTHATIYQQLEPQALQFVLPPKEAPPPEFGFEVQCSPKS